MKLLRTLLLILASFLTWQSIQGQDLHFTLFDHAPLWVNPAYTGNFKGTFRVGGVYRDQWTYPAGVTGYKTPMAFLDIPIIRGLRPYDWVGAGLMFASDRAGTLDFGRTEFRLSAAYFFAFDKERKTVISLGGQYGTNNFGFNVTNIEDRNQLLNRLGLGGDAQTMDDLLMGAGDEQGRIDNSVTTWNAGLALRTELNETMKLNLGVSLFNLTAPNSSFRGASGPGGGGGGGGGGGIGNNNVPDDLKLPSRLLLHGNMRIALNQEWSLNPSFLYQSQRSVDEIQIQTRAGYLINPEKDVTLQAGLGYRLRDAVQLVLGAQVKDLTVGFGYDLTTSDLSNAANPSSSWEIAAMYIAKIYKEPEIPPVIFCPSF